MNAKVGGKQIPAQNMALDDAERLGKACLQISNDIESGSSCRNRVDGHRKPHWQKPLQQAELPYDTK